MGGLCCYCFRKKESRTRIYHGMIIDDINHETDRFVNRYLRKRKSKQLDRYYRRLERYYRLNSDRSSLDSTGSTDDDSKLVEDDDDRKDCKYSDHRRCLTSRKRPLLSNLALSLARSNASLVESQISSSMGASKVSSPQFRCRSVYLQRKQSPLRRTIIRRKIGSKLSRNCSNSSQTSSNTCKSLLNDYNSEDKLFIDLNDKPCRIASLRPLLLNMNHIERVNSNYKNKKFFNKSRLKDKKFCKKIKLNKTSKDNKKKEDIKFDEKKVKFLTKKFKMKKIMNPEGCAQTYHRNVSNISLKDVPKEIVKTEEFQQISMKKGCEDIPKLEIQFKIVSKAGEGNRNQDDKEGEKPTDDSTAKAKTEK